MRHRFFAGTERQHGYAELRLPIQNSIEPTLGCRLQRLLNLTGSRVQGDLEAAIADHQLGLGWDFQGSGIVHKDEDDIVVPGHSADHPVSAPIDAIEITEDNDQMIMSSYPSCRFQRAIERHRLDWRQLIGFE